MSDFSLPGYDAWKTMSPDEEQPRRKAGARRIEERARATPTFLRGECDCCGEHKPQLWRTVYLNIETFVCADCCQANDEPEDDR